MNDQYDSLAISPDAAFESRLRAQLKERLSAPGQSAGESTNDIELVTVQAKSVDARRHGWRLTNIVLAAAASITLLLAATVLVKRNSDENTGSELQTVDPAEALPLAKKAFITADALGSRWRLQEMFTDSIWAQQTAATIAARPECAELTSVGLFTPTTKSVVARQSFSPGRNYVGHTVFVFATKQDASRAMDVIAGDVYPSCWFDLFDRLIPLGSTLGTNTSTSQASDAPAITPHGDRQIIIGQNAVLVGSDATVNAYFVNAYVQVGRAISWINPMSGGTGDTAPVAAEKAITATATALDSAFGS
jgi:hypothetical protein